MSIEGDSAKLLSIDEGHFIHGVIITVAPEKSSGFDPNIDFFLRFFVPWYGINEDPATGSAQCGVAPLWSKLLKKNYFKGRYLIE
jgi:predicted PhzF superfamily epimerase YddE/YHI9